MIFSRDLLFVHVPKAGGMALTTHLLNVLPRPVYYSVPDGHSRFTDPGIICIPGYRHENLAEATAIVANYGFQVASFPLILAAIRNPYSLEVSRYAYLQKGHPWDAGHNQRLAMEENFETFAIRSVEHARPIQSYFEIDGQIPPNLMILRCEDLADDLRSALQRIGLDSGQPLLRENESAHGAYDQYYTRTAEEAVYNRYRWVFERGFYKRIDRDSLAFVQAPHAIGPRLLLAGPVQQIGVASGLWHDGWVGGVLRFHVQTTEPIGGLVVEGKLPYLSGDSVELTVSVGSLTTRHRVQGTGSFRIDSRAMLNPGGSRIPVELATSAVFCPRAVGQSEDDRHLSFVLTRITFLTAGASSREYTS